MDEIVSILQNSRPFTAIDDAKKLETLVWKFSSYEINQFDVKESNGSETLLHLAARSGIVELVQLILPHFVDEGFVFQFEDQLRLSSSNSDSNNNNFVNYSKMRDINCLNSQSETPLMIASTTKLSLPITKLLLLHGADPNPKIRTKTPEGNYEIVAQPILQRILSEVPEPSQKRMQIEVVKLLFSFGIIAKPMPRIRLYEILTLCTQYGLFCSKEFTTHPALQYEDTSKSTQPQRELTTWIQNSKFYDIAMVVGQKKECALAHRCIVSARSPFLSSILHDLEARDVSAASKNIVRINATQEPVVSFDSITHLEFQEIWGNFSHSSKQDINPDKLTLIFIEDATLEQLQKVMMFMYTAEFHFLNQLDNQIPLRYITLFQITGYDKLKLPETIPEMPIPEPTQIITNQECLTIQIMTSKNQRFNVRNLTLASSLHTLKHEIYLDSNIPSDQQKLYFKNSLVQASDEANLASLGITDGCWILVSYTNREALLLHMEMQELLQKDLMEILNSKNHFSDITFQVDNQPYLGHKLIATRIPKINAMLSSGMKEANQSSIEIPDMSFDCWCELMKSVITDFPPIISNHEQAKVALELIPISDEYLLEDLKMKCQTALSTILGIGNVKFLFEYAEQHNCKYLQEQCIQYVKEHLTLVKHKYGENIPQKVRDSLADFEKKFTEVLATPEDAPITESFQVFIKTLTGKTITLDIQPDYTLDNLMGCLMNKSGIPPDQLRFIFGGRQIEEGVPLIDYGVRKESTIHCVLRLRGGH